MAEQKSAYEIRLEILRLSKEFIENQYQLNRDLALANWEQNREIAKSAGISLPAVPDLPIPSFDTLMDISEKMNQFVSQKIQTPLDIPTATVDEIKNYFGQIQNLLTPSKKTTK